MRSNSCDGNGSNNPITLTPDKCPILIHLAHFDMLGYACKSDVSDSKWHRFTNVYHFYYNLMLFLLQNISQT